MLSRRRARAVSMEVLALRLELRDVELAHLRARLAAVTDLLIARLGKHEQIRWTRHGEHLAVIEVHAEAPPKFVRDHTAREAR